MPSINIPGGEGSREDLKHAIAKPSQVCYHIATVNLQLVKNDMLEARMTGRGKVSLQDASLHSASPSSTYTCSLKLSVSSLPLLGCDSLLYEGIFKLLPVSLFSLLFD